MVDNNNYQTTYDNLKEENIVEEPNTFINNQIQNQNQNQNTQINNKQNDSKEVRDKSAYRRRLISMIFCFCLIAITIGSEIMQLKLKLFSIFLLIDDLIVFANCNIYLILFFFDIKIDNYWFLIPHAIVIFGGIAFKVVGVRVFSDGIMRIIQFILLCFKVVGLLPIPCWLTG